MTNLFRIFTIATLLSYTGNTFLLFTQSEDTDLLSSFKGVVVDIDDLTDKQCIEIGEINERIFRSISKIEKAYSWPDVRSIDFRMIAPVDEEPGWARIAPHFESIRNELEIADTLCFQILPENAKPLIHFVYARNIRPLAELLEYQDGVSIESDGIFIRIPENTLDSFYAEIRLSKSGRILSKSFERIHSQKEHPTHYAGYNFDYNSSQKRYRQDRIDLVHYAAKSHKYANPTLKYELGNERVLVVLSSFFGKFGFNQYFSIWKREGTFLELEYILDGTIGDGGMFAEIIQVQNINGAKLILGKTKSASCGDSSESIWLGAWRHQREFILIASEGYSTTYLVGKSAEEYIKNGLGPVAWLDYRIDSAICTFEINRYELHYDRFTNEPTSIDTSLTELRIPYCSLLNEE